MATGTPGACNACAFAMHVGPWGLTLVSLRQGWPTIVRNCLRSAPAQAGGGLCAAGALKQAQKEQQQAKTTTIDFKIQKQLAGKQQKGKQVRWGRAGGRTGRWLTTHLLCST